MTSSIESSPGIEIGANIESNPVVFHESSFVAVSYGGHLGLLKLTKDWKSEDSTVHGLIYCESQIIPLHFFKNEAKSLPSNPVVEEKVIIS